MTGIEQGMLMGGVMILLLVLRFSDIRLDMAPILIAKMGWSKRERSGHRDSAGG